MDNHVQNRINRLERESSIWRIFIWDIRFAFFSSSVKICCLEAFYSVERHLLLLHYWSYLREVFRKPNRFILADNNPIKYSVVPTAQCPHVRLQWIIIYFFILSVCVQNNFIWWQFVLVSKHFFSLRLFDGFASLIVIHASTIIRTSTITSSFCFIIFSFIISSNI